MISNISGKELKGIIEIYFVLENTTGLLIRAPGAKMVIGGADVMPMASKRKYMLSKGERVLEVPYIPGSSFKGRMRSLLEVLLGKDLFSTDGRIYQHFRYFERREEAKITCTDPKCPVDTIFGHPSFHIGEVQKFAPLIGEDVVRELLKVEAPTRLSVSDLWPTTACIERLIREKELEIGVDRILLSDFLEEKAENRIDRLTAAADPRTFLRIKPHIEFEGIMNYEIYLESDIEMLKYVFVGMKLVEDTYLGGCGTRGYGKIVFKKIKITPKPKDYYMGKIKKENLQYKEYVIKQDKTAIEKALEDLDSIIRFVEENLGISRES